MAASAKPPNIFVLSDAKDGGDQTFHRTRAELEACLSPDHYTIYPLSKTDAARQPWQDNCLLLIIPPHVILTAEGEESVLQYAKSNGSNCLSVNRRLTHLLTGTQWPAGSFNAQSLVTVTPCDGDSIKPFHTLSINCEDTSNNSTAVTDLTNATITELATTGSPILPPAINGGDHTTAEQISCVQLIQWTNKVFSEDKMSLLYSSVHLFTPLSYSKDDMNDLLKIKETGKERHHFLCTVLTSLGLACKVMESASSDLSYLYFITQRNSLRDKLVSSLESVEDGSSPLLIKGNESNALFVTDDYSIGTPVDPIPDSTEKQVTVIVNPSQRQLDSLEFDISLYFKSLKSSVSLGQSLLFGPVMTSSQTLFTGNTTLTRLLSNDLGVVCIPGQQTKGKGRGGNAWLSPKGCMMFSCPIKFPEGSRLSNKASIVQHIATLSVVTAIRKRPGYEHIPFNVKWPNDIYFNKIKLGGCLVNAYTLDKVTTVIIGLGINVDNHYPTVSVNDCIALYNKERQTELPPLKVEELLATSLSNLEMYLSLFNQWGLTAIEELYYRYWIHHNSTVELSGYPGVESAIIIGINEYGYLRVKTPDNQFLLLGPDGNSFDIMKGLICMK